METPEPTPLLILIVEDDLSHATLLHRAFRRSERPCRLTDVRTLREARAWLERYPVDVIVADYVLPDGKGLDLLGSDPRTLAYPVVLMTAFGDERLAVEAIKRGAMDYVVKTPEAMVALPQTVERVLREWQLRFEYREVEEGLNRARRELEALDRQLREERSRANRLALQAHAADVAKGAFLAAISHEIRTPMNAVLGFSRLALNLPDLPSVAQRYLTTILSKGEDLLRLIDNAVDMARLEAGSLELAPASVNVPALVADLVESMGVKAASKGLALTMTLAPGVPSALTGDAGRLGQVLSNLLDNAIKFTERGQVEVRVGPTGGDAAGPVTLRFEVRDTGPGIPEGKRALLFGLFSQLEPGEMRRHSGLGLGLAVSKRLVERMGGEIGLLSDGRQGSTFFFTAPFTRLESSGPAAPPPAPAARPARILLAEDDPDCRTLVAEIMAKNGHSVRAERDGAAALLAWESGDFDLVFVDLRMPTLDGFDLVRAIRAREQGTGRRVPVVALTACVLEDEEARCRATGMDACVGKPFRDQTLLDLVARFLGPARPSEAPGA